MANKTLVKMVDRDGNAADVHPDEVENYKDGGYMFPKDAPKPDKTAKAEKQDDDEAETDDATSTTPIRCAFIKEDGEQCGNDAVKDKEFCHIKSHK